MQKSTECEFVLLGCAPTNLATVAYPFVVVLRGSANQRRPLKGYLLNGWQNIREFFPDDVREDILFFLDSLQHYAPGPESEGFFAQLDSLSVGPIRTIASGSCSADELDGKIAAILDAGEAAVLWPESFRALGTEERQTDKPD